MSKRTRIKPSKTRLVGVRLFADFGGIGYYKILRHYEWKEYHPHVELPNGGHWLKKSMVKIKTEYGVVMKIPFIELGMKSVYAESGERVLR